MNGTLSSITEIILILVPLVLIISLALSFFSSAQGKETYLNLPRGIDISLESADTKIFVLPPVVWFGERLSLDGTKFVNFEKVFDEDNTESTDFIFPTNNVYIDTTKESLYVLSQVFYNPLFILTEDLYFNFETSKPIQPVVAFYPLLTDYLGSPENPGILDVLSGEEICYLNSEEPFGRIKLTLTIDTENLYKYYRTNKYKFDRYKAEENINLSLEYFTDLDFEPRNYLETIGLDDYTISLEDMMVRGICEEDSDLYICTFVFNTVKECCPDFVNIKPLLIVNLEKNGIPRWMEEEIDSIPFQIVYYLDYIKDDDFIFNNFLNIQEEVFSKEDGNHPVEDILIYPCRAIVPQNKMGLLPSRVKSFDFNIIYWDSCGSTTDFIKLKNKDLEQESGWYCKESGQVYLIYNPYAFCRLDGKELPEIPKPVYLYNIIPSGNLPIEWGPWIIPNVRYKEFKEAALFWAFYMIETTTKALKDGKNIDFPEKRCEPIGDVDVCIYYTFD